MRVIYTSIASLASCNSRLAASASDARALAAAVDAQVVRATGTGAGAVAGAGAGAGEGAPGGAAPVSASEKSRVGPTADGAGDGVWLEGTLMTVEGAEAETPAAAAGLG